MNLWPYSYMLKRIKEATLEAQAQGLRPILAREAVRNFRQVRHFNIPYLGDYVPEGWRQMPGVAWYVSTVEKNENTQAMPMQEFYTRILKNVTSTNQGYGVLEQGQRQVLIALFERKEMDGS